MVDSMLSQNESSQSLQDLLDSIFIVYSFETDKPSKNTRISNTRLPKHKANVTTFEYIKILPKAFEFTMLGHAAGGGAFLFKNGSIRFGSLHTGYPLIFPVILTNTGQQSKYDNQSQASKQA